MARIYTVGYEVAAPITGNAVQVDSPLTVSPSGAISRDTSLQRTGTGCLKCDSAAGNAIAAVPILTFAASTTFYVRAFYRFTDLPTSTARIMGAGTGELSGVFVMLTSGGKLQLWNNQTVTQIGSDSAVTLTTGTYYRVEVMAVLNSSTQVTAVELRLDGTTVASASGLTITGVKSTFKIGWTTAPGASKVLYIDDVAVNNSTGTVNNSWCGDGRVVMLLPASNNSVGLWQSSTGGSIGNAWDAINNVPPLGVADLTVGSDGKQIRNALANANASADLTMQTYTDVGVPAGATINMVIPWVCTAAPVATSAKAGTIGCLNNPAISQAALGAGGTAGAFWSGVAGGTYPTGWKWSPGTITEAPSVTLGLGPTMRINQVTSSTRIAVVCFLGMYVDYTPAVVVTRRGPQNMKPRQAVVVPAHAFHPAVYT